MVVFVVHECIIWRIHAFIRCCINASVFVVVVVVVVVVVIEAIVVVVVVVVVVGVVDAVASVTLVLSPSPE